MTDTTDRPPLPKVGMDDDPDQVRQLRVASGLEVSTQVDYFKFSDTERYYFPDGSSYVDFKVFTEGDRRKLQNKTASDVTLGRGGEAKVRTAAGDSRFELLSMAITGWNLLRDGNPIPCAPNTVKIFLEAANPKIIDGIEKAVRLANPWLLADMSAEDIRQEIADLQEMLAKVEAEEAGKAS